MYRFASTRHTLAGCTAAVMLASCGGSQSMIGVPAAQTPPLRSDGIAAWDLLYVSNGNGVVNVYRYWQRKLVRVLGGFQQPVGECVDKAGDIYIADYGAKKVIEYAHGGKKPLRVLNLKPYRPFGCAVDLKSGNLAVVNDSGPNGGDVAIYKRAKGKPLQYTGGSLEGYKYCAYDDRGNLLITDGADYSSSYYYSAFAMLPKNGVKLVSVEIAGSGTSSGSVYFVGATGLQWDGQAWVVGNYTYLSRISITGSTGTIVGSTQLTGAIGEVGPFWILKNKTQGSQGTQVVSTWSGEDGNGGLGFWKYPSGGNSIAQITHGIDQPFGVAVSLRK